MKLSTFYVLRILLLLPTSASLLGQPVPHHFSGITSSNGTIIVSLDGSVSNMFPLPVSVSSQFMQMFDLYVLDSSQTLSTWTRESILVRTNNDPKPLLYAVTNDGSGSARFYRTPTNNFITGFPKPTGPFAVGTLVHVLTDSSRTNRYGLATNSSFMVTFWYPADPPNISNLPGVYTDAQVAEDRNFYPYFAWPLQWTNIM